MPREIVTRADASWYQSDINIRDFSEIYIINNESCTISVKFIFVLRIKLRCNTVAYENIQTFTLDDFTCYIKY